MIARFGLLLLLLPGTQARAGEQFFFVGLPGQAVYKAIVDPQNPSTIYALANHTRLYKTVDSGANWTLMWEKSYIYELFVHPQNPSLLYAAGTGFHVSSDGGRNWTERAAGSFRSCVMDPLNPNVFFAWVDKSQEHNLYDPQYIYKTMDDGITWDLFKKIEPHRVAFTYVYDIGLYIHPTNPNLIFVSVAEAFPHCGGAFFYYMNVTTDGGQNWSELAWDSRRYLLVDYYPELIIKYGGRSLFKSTDQGATWIIDNNGILASESIVSVISDPVWRGGMYAMFYSEGVYWRAHHSLPWQFLGGSQLNIEDMAIDVQNGIIYLGTTNGVWMTKPSMYTPPHQVSITSPQPLATLYGSVLIQGKAEGFQSINTIQIFIDDVKAGEIPGNGGGSQDFSWSWDTRVQGMGAHTINVKAIDSGNFSSQKQIPTKVENIIVKVTTERTRDRSWLMRRSVVKLDIRIDNRGQVPGAVYSILRRNKNELDWHTIATFNESQVKNGAYLFMDIFQRTSATHEYQVNARALGVLQGASDTVEI